MSDRPPTRLFSMSLYHQATASTMAVAILVGAPLRACVDCWSGHPDSEEVRHAVTRRPLSRPLRDLIVTVEEGEWTVHRIVHADVVTVGLACGAVWTWDAIWRSHNDAM